MKFDTTITAMKDGICLFETDVVVIVDHKVDRYNELEWWVDEYRVEGTRRTWDDTANQWIETKVDTKVPQALAEVFNHYLDEGKIEEKIREQLAEERYERADFARDLAMDR